jgi:transcriptional regulator with XRE-family HTH domain
MTSHLGTYFKAMRLARGLTLDGLARLTGYRDRRKVAGRIARFEQEGVVKDELLSRLAAALDVDYPTVEALMAQANDQDTPPARSES